MVFTVIIICDFTSVTSLSSFQNDFNENLRFCTMFVVMQNQSRELKSKSLPIRFEYLDFWHRIHSICVYRWVNPGEKYPKLFFFKFPTKICFYVSTHHKNQIRK